MSLDWRVELIRLTLFLDETHNISDKDWSIITGQDEAETRQAVPGGKRLSGTVPNGALQMSMVGSRFDVVLTARILEEAEEFTLPSVGTLEETFKTFFESTSNWIGKTGPSVIRIAFGSVLTCQTESPEVSYTQLKGVLKSLNVDPKKMRDIHYRVNWPRSSTVEQGLNINRLTTWSSLRLVRKLLQIDAGGVSSDASGDEVYGVRLEADNNTEETRKTPFDRANLIPIYSELMGLARENAAKGEVP